MVLKKLFVTLVIVLGVGITGLIVYSYLYLGQGGKLAVRGETAVSASSLILRTSRGIFLDKDAAVNLDQQAPQLGYRAPDFTFDDLEGNPVSLSDFLGKPVLLNFWATWCPPCRKEIPDLQKFHQKYGDKIVLLGIDWGEDVEEVKKFLTRYGVTYTTLMDKDGKFFVRYGLTGLPTSYWVDETGVIRGIWEGAMEIEDMINGFKKTTRVFDAQDPQP